MWCTRKCDWMVSKLLINVSYENYINLFCNSSEDWYKDESEEKPSRKNWVWSHRAVHLNITFIRIGKSRRSSTTKMHQTIANIYFPLLAHSPIYEECLDFSYYNCWTVNRRVILTTQTNYQHRTQWSCWNLRVASNNM